MTINVMISNKGPYDLYIDTEESYINEEGLKISRHGERITLLSGQCQEVTIWKGKVFTLTEDMKIAGVPS